jgi:hypothetical protein
VLLQKKHNKYIIYIEQIASRCKVWLFIGFEKINRIIKNKEIGIEFISCSSFSNSSRIHRILTSKQFRPFGTGAGIT